MNFALGRFCFQKFGIVPQSRRLFYTAHPAYNENKKHKFHDTESKTEFKLRSSDGIADNFRIVYKGPMEAYFLSTQVFSSSSVIGSVALFVYKNIQAWSLGLTFYEVARLDETTPVELYSVLVVTSLLMISTLFVSLKYPLRIYKDQTSNRYQYMKYTPLPFIKKKYEFVAGDLKCSKSKNEHMQNVYFYDGKNKNGLIIFPHYLKNPAVLDNMTGAKGVVKKSYLRDH